MLFYLFTYLLIDDTSLKDALTKLVVRATKSFPIIEMSPKNTVEMLCKN